MKLHLLIESFPDHPNELNNFVNDCIGLLKFLQGHYEIFDVNLRESVPQVSIKTGIETETGLTVIYHEAEEVRFHQIKELITPFQKADILMVIQAKDFSLNENIGLRLIVNAVEKGNSILGVNNLSIQAFSIGDLKMAYDQNYRPNYINEIEVLKTFGFPINYLPT